MWVKDREKLPFMQPMTSHHYHENSMVPAAVTSSTYGDYNLR